jgi:hypothetical protein
MTMTDFPNLSAELTESLSSLWTCYAGKRPSNGRTEIRGNVVTCVLVGADREPGVAARGVANFETDAAEAVSRITRQRVSALLSSRDAATGVARETFTLEPSLGRGASELADRGPKAKRFRLRLVDGRHADH